MTRTSIATPLFAGLYSLSLLTAAFAEAPPRHRILIAEYNPAGHRLLEVSPEGQLVWQHKLPGFCVQFQVLANGNIVYGYSGKPTGTREIDRDGKIVWSYESPSPEAVCFERLAGGNTLVAETDPCRVVEVTPAGKIVSTVKITTSDSHYHTQIRRIQHLENGNILAALSGEEVAREFRPDGSVAWENGKHHWLFQALRLPGGNTLLSCGTENRLVEVDPSGKTVWELTPQDVPEVGMIWTTGVERLENGNLLVSNFLHGRKEPGAHAFEVTRDKKVVWKFSDRKLVNATCLVKYLDEK
jgi:outer membrane protein assembly factor BamB